MKTMDLLEGYKESEQVYGHFTTVPRPYDEYLGRITNKRYEKQSPTDEETVDESTHSQDVASKGYEKRRPRLARCTRTCLPGRHL
jgi:hypothetical protein